MALMACSQAPLPSQASGRDFNTITWGCSGGCARLELRDARVGLIVRAANLGVVSGYGFPILNVLRGLRTHSKWLALAC